MSNAPVAEATRLPGNDTSGTPPVKLLLVDDRRENLIALAAVLESLGHEMVLARSGMEALKHLLTDDFAVILLDVQMPDLDGFETATLIKQREKSRYIPIIFITAISKDEKYVFQGYQSGAVDYLSKPIDPDMLRSKVAVFADLYRQKQEIQRQAEELRLAEQREAELLREEEARVAERRHMAALAEREAELRQFKATLDATLDAVLLLDPETLRFFYVNAGAVSLLGYEEEELLGKSPAEIGAFGDEAEFRQMLALASAEVPPKTFETQCRHRSGTSIPVEILLQFVAPREGGSARYVAIIRDITERKRAEIQLARLYQREKKIAETLQQSIVTAPPEDLFAGLTISTLYQAAWEEANVGGDYLDVFALDKGKVALVVGDVSGKGLTAAARTAEVKYALRAFLREAPDPARAFNRLNALLCETSRLEGNDFGEMKGMGGFICIALAVVDPESGEATFSLAGAEPPLVVRSDGSFHQITGGGMPLGISPEERHINQTERLSKGDILLLTTDGITEARTGYNFFGYERFAEAAQNAAVSTGSIKQVGKAVLEAARTFAGGKLHDDACLLLATRY